MKWRVEVSGYEPEVFEAETERKARWKAYRAFNEAYPCSFRLFLARGVRVRRYVEVAHD